MSSKVNYRISENSITVVCDGVFKVFEKGNQDFNEIVALVKGGSEDAILNYMDRFREVRKAYSEAGFRVENDVVFVPDEWGVDLSLPQTLGQRLIMFAKEGLPYEPLLSFWHKLRKNPDVVAIQRLFECLEVNHHPFTPDGNFIAYKRVRADYKDIYSGTFDNSPGKTVRVDRSQVDANPDKTCSFGCHAASYDYAKNRYMSRDPGTDKLVEVEINPADVVAVPRDYGSKKLRVCSYRVLRDATQEILDLIYDV